MPKSFWLVKTEPTSFSIDDLAASPGQTTCWDGVRNYLARNHMRAMQIGDEVLIYHSNVDPLAIVGVATVVRRAYPDPTAWNKHDHHFDPKASLENPIWDMVDLKLKETFPTPLPLDQLRGEPRLAKMELLRRGSRLSVQPVSESEYAVIQKMAHAKKTTHAEPQSRSNESGSKESRSKDGASKARRKRVSPPRKKVRPAVSSSNRREGAKRK